MSIAFSLLDLALEEAGKQNCERLLLVRVEYGPLAGIMPEALSLCFEAAARERGQEGIVLELVRLPLRLRCPFCGSVFEGAEKEDVWKPCPKCGENFGHVVEQGRELLLARLEAC